MTLPAGPAPAGLTDMDIDAATAPVGIPLWPESPSDAPGMTTLIEVATVRRMGVEKPYVRWTYQTGGTQHYGLTERVGVRVNLADLHTAR